MSPWGDPALGSHPPASLLPVWWREALLEVPSTVPRTWFLAWPGHGTDLYWGLHEYNFDSFRPTWAVVF